MRLNLSGKHVETKSAEERQIMRVGGLIWQSIKDYLSEKVKVGMDLSTIEELTRAQFERYGVESSFNLQGDFPSILCLSLNECVVHGSAQKGVKVQVGDKLSIDFGFSYRGLNIDAAFNLFFGLDSTSEKIEEREKREEIERREAEFNYLQQLTLALFYDSIQDLKAGQMSGSITERMELFFKKYFPKKYSFLEKFTGHAIGKTLHEYPRIHNFGFKKNEGEILPLHSTVCIEPMIVEQENGKWKRGSDGYGICIKNQGGLTIHYEHVVLILEDGVELLTASPWELKEMKDSWTLIKQL